jgi:RNA polymerase sigma factor for flagellar operon FliA
MAKTPTHGNTRPAIRHRDLWQAFARAHGKARDELRKQLLLVYLPTVKYAAERLASKLPSQVNEDDLCQAGIFGLRDAIESFDLNRGVKFETYCATRVRGAMLDELRAMDWVPRLVRSRSHKVLRATDALTMTLGRPPTADEVAAYLGIPEDELTKMVRDTAALASMSLFSTAMTDSAESEPAALDILADDKIPDPTVAFADRDLRTFLLRGLNRSERLLLILYYYEEMTMKEIGAALELSESRVSQMHSALLLRLKARLSTLSYDAMAELR